MKAPLRKFLLPLLILLALSNISFSQKSVPEDFCLSDQEYRLYELINAYRVLNGMKEIPLSRSLSFVARTHVYDLFNNRPDTSICNLNSWSDKGEWTACCHNKYLPREDCIRNKPRELTEYTGEGYELTYAEIADAHPDTVFKFWKKIDEAGAFILNTGTWKDKSWKALGIGIYKNYAVMWLGQKADPAGIPEPCTQQKEKRERNTKEAISAGNVPLISSGTGRYYIIIASFQTESDARQQIKKYADVNDASFIIIKNEQGQFRISVNDYPSLDAAKQGKEKFKKDFKDAWILNF